MSIIKEIIAEMKVLTDGLEDKMTEADEFIACENIRKTIEEAEEVFKRYKKYNNEGE